MGIRHGAIWLALAVLGSFLVLMALRAAPAAACTPEGPCASPTEKVLCPFMPVNSKGTGTAEFDIPKDARNVKYTIKDATTGQVYGPGASICSGTTLAVTEERTSNLLDDTYKVTYELTSDGTSNPSEEHDVIVTADWSRESDLEATKDLLGSFDFGDAEKEFTVALTVKNHGPAPTKGVIVRDESSAFGTKDVEVTGVEQSAGPKPTFAPKVRKDEEKEFTEIYGEWGVLQPGEEVTVLVHIRVKKGLRKFGDALHADHRFDSKRVEPTPDPHRNHDYLDFVVRSAPDSKITSAKARRATGTAKAAGPQGPALGAMRPGVGIEQLLKPSVKRVQVAILRLGGGKALQGGLPERPTKKAGGCKWLAGRGGHKFKGRERAANGYCDSPVWLAATGTTQWSLELAHSLPFGKYVVYSRAVGADGVGESEFTAKDGNRKQIFVH